MRGEKRFGQGVGHLQARGQGDAAHRTTKFVVLVARTDEITADHRLYGQSFEFSHHHGAPGQLCTLSIVRHHIRDTQTREMIRDDVRGLREPEQGNLSEDFALEGYGVGQHHIESGQAVAGDDQQMLGIHVVDVTHLSLVNFLETAQS